MEYSFYLIDNNSLITPRVYCINLCRECEIEDDSGLILIKINSKVVGQLFMTDIWKLPNLSPLILALL